MSFRYVMIGAPALNTLFPELVRFLFRLMDYKG
jgi:hypothetical protein